MEVFVIFEIYVLYRLLIFLLMIVNYIEWVIVFKYIYMLMGCWKEVLEILNIFKV